MPNPVINIPFSSGTVITSPWLNGVNDLANDLVNTTDYTKGAARIGFDNTNLAAFFKTENNRVVDSIAALKTLDKTKYTRAFLTGYYTAGDGGGGSFWFDPSDTTSVDNGGTIIVAADGGRWKLQQTGWIDVRQFGAKGDGVADDTAALTNMQAFVAGQSSPWLIQFSAGIYSYTVSPNWAQNNVRVSFKGTVKLRYKGVGNAVILDGGAVSPNMVQDFRFGNHNSQPIIECPKSALNAIFARSLNIGTEVHAIVRGAGNSSAGLFTNWCVLTYFNVQVAPYQPGWYDDGTGPAKPMYGMLLSQRGTGEQTSYCTFMNPVGISCQYGFYLDYTLGNVFIGGDAEFNTNIGMLLSVNAFNNKIHGTDFEINTTMDVSCAGFSNEFRCDTSGGPSGGFRFVSGSAGNKLIGGTHNQVAVDAGTGNYIGGITYQRGLSGNLQIIDNGVNTGYGRNWAAQQAKYTYGPSSLIAVTVGASPFTYTNTTGMPLQVFITGGTVSAQIAFRGATQLGFFASGSLLSSGDSLSLTYSAIPTVVTATLE